MAYEGLEDNKNAEKWTLEEATNFMIQAVELSQLEQYDFIGEVAKAQESYHQVYPYLCDKFPELERLFKLVKANCESNCFSNGKKGSIVPSLAIMNLKSNHGWTDRIDTTTKDKPIQQQILNIDPLSEYDKTDDSIKED